MAYSDFQALHPICFNFGATVAAGTAETWGLTDIPAGVPTMHLLAAYLTNGANLTGSGTNFTTIEVRKGTTVMADYAVDTATTDDLTADTPKAMNRSATIANRKLAASDTNLNARKVETGTGMALTAQACLALWFQVGTEDLTE